MTENVLRDVAEQLRVGGYFVVSVESKLGVWWLVATDQAENGWLIRHPEDATALLHNGRL